VKLTTHLRLVPKNSAGSAMHPVRHISLETWGEISHSVGGRENAYWPARGPDLALPDSYLSGHLKVLGLQGQISE